MLVASRGGKKGKMVESRHGPAAVTGYESHN